MSDVNVTLGTTEEIAVSVDDGGDVTASVGHPHAASAVSVDPSGLIAVTTDDVQAALAELDAAVDGATSVATFGRVDDGTDRAYSIPGVDVDNIAAIGRSANQIYYEPMVLPSAAVLDQLAIETTTAGAGGALARVALYKADGAWQPTDLVVDSGDLAIDSTGIKTTTGVSEALAAGRYVRAFNHDDASAAFRVYTGGHNLPGLHWTLGTASFIREIRVAAALGAYADPGTAYDTQLASTAAFRHMVLCRFSSVT